MKKQRNKGITLVALVVTIIILLILAGITISQLTGSGLFEKAQLAEQKSKNAREKEDGILSDYENKIGEYVEGSGREEQKTCIGISPDYSAKVSLLSYSSSANQYTTTSGGYIVVPSFATRTVGTNVGQLKIYIDNQIIAWNANSCTGWYRDSICLPVSSNSKVYYEIAQEIVLDNNIYFVPNK